MFGRFVFDFQQTKANLPLCSQEGVQYQPAKGQCSCSRAGCQLVFLFHNLPFGFPLKPPIAFLLELFASAATAQNGVLVFPVAALHFGTRLGRGVPFTLKNQGVNPNHSGLTC